MPKTATNGEEKECSSDSSRFNWPLDFTIISECDVTKCRSGTIKLPHQVVESPVFMPVGTQGTMKGLTVHELEDLGPQIILGNTYHLGMRPGMETLKLAGGLHKFMNWKRALLTDSGGFQMVSLIELSEITEEGVKFNSPYDGKEIMLSPEKSMEIQNAIGADIMMQLDDVVHSTTEGPRVEEAMWRSIRWLDRCIASHNRKEDQNLFPILQGGLDLSLREKCIEEMLRRDLPGVAIGGLSGGEDKNLFWKVVQFCTNQLPRNKPRYLMGVGYAVDLVVCCALGVDMFDCVYPTRTARFGTALVPWGQLQLKSKQFANDFTPIDRNCSCATCRKHTRAYVHSLIVRETVGSHLLTVHNIAYQMTLMKNIRDSVKQGTFVNFVQSFFREYFPNGDYPKWAVDALEAVNIILNPSGDS